MPRITRDVPAAGLFSELFFPTLINSIEELPFSTNILAFLMGDNNNENLLSISQKLLKKISNRNISPSDTNSESGSESNITMESPEIIQSKRVRIHIHLQ
jgi:hypothetical protein